MVTIKWNTMKFGLDIHESVVCVQSQVALGTKHAVVNQAAVKQNDDMVIMSLQNVLHFTDV